MLFPLHFIGYRGIGKGGDDVDHDDDDDGRSHWWDSPGINCFEFFGSGERPTDRSYT